jgi:hypothetical protein
MDARHHEVATFDVGIGLVAAEVRAARVPAEVVQFVTGLDMSTWPIWRPKVGEPGFRSTTPMASGRVWVGSMIAT